MNLLKQIILIMLFLAFVSCGKEFLDIKRNTDQDVPSTIQDYQAILDRTSNMNATSHDLSFVGADEFYISNMDELITGSIYAPFHKNAYLWLQDVYENEESRDWNDAYQRILYANMALDVEKINPSLNEKEAWSNVKGSALFHRAWNYYQLVQLFCKPYDKVTAQHDLGVPLRLDYDVSVKYGRGTVQQVYDQIISDLLEAEILLPDKPKSSFRPSKGAVYALLTRLYLQMEDYEKAFDYSNKGLSINPELIDLNNYSSTVNSEYASVFLRHGAENPAIIYSAVNNAGGIMGSARFNVDSSLFYLYAENDLRKNVYFFRTSKGNIVFVGSYNGEGHTGFFTGLSVEELLLTHAECMARAGEVNESMIHLNYFLKHRYKVDTFKPLSASNSKEALSFILLERRKELYMRGIRWEDLRRFNKDPYFASTLVREFENNRYELFPNDSRWTWPIPDNEVSLNGLEQNVR